MKASQPLRESPSTRILQPIDDAPKLLVLPRERLIIAWFSCRFLTQKAELRGANNFVMNLRTSWAERSRWCKVFYR